MSECGNAAPKRIYTWIDLFAAGNELPGMRINAERAGVLVVSISLFILACVSPAILIGDAGKHIVWHGSYVLANGIFAVFGGQFGWFANFWYVMSLLSLLFGNWKGVRNFSVIAVLLGLSSFFLLGKQIPKNEGGVGDPYMVLQFELGFYLWLASFAVMLLLGATLSTKKQTSNSASFE